MKLFRLAKDKDGSVADHICHRGSVILWGWNWIKEPSSQQDWINVGELMGMLQNINLASEKDSWKWVNDDGLGYSVKGVRKELDEARNGANADPPFVWNSWATAKANFLLWRASSGKVAAKMALVGRGVAITNTHCDRCGVVDEDVNHTFVSCLFARSIWWSIFRWIRIQWPTRMDSVEDLLHSVLNETGSRRWRKLILMVAMAASWKIWQARNAAVFDGKFIPVQRTVDEIKEESFLWVRHRANGHSISWDDWSNSDVSYFV